MKKGDLILSWNSDERGNLAVDRFIEKVDEEVTRVREIGPIPEEEVFTTVMYYMKGHGIDKFEYDGMTLVFEGKKEE